MEAGDRLPLRALVAGLTLLALSIALPAGAVDGAVPGAPQGNATPSLRTAKGVASVAESAPVDGRVAILVHNGTARPVRVQVVEVVATSPEGGLAVRARTAATYPQVLRPDELALASVRFRAKDVAGQPDLKLTVKVHSRPVSSAQAAQVLSVGDLALSAPQSGAVAQTMQATLTNPTKSWTARAPEAAVVCFGEAGDPTTFARARATTHRVAPGRSVSTTVPLASLCPTYLVAARAS